MLGSGRSPGEGNGNLLQDSGLGHPMCRGAWRATNGATESWTRLSDQHLLANAGDMRDTGSIPGWVRSSGGGHDNSFQYSCLENPTDRGA